jgi:hypothetical protein
VDVLTRSVLRLRTAIGICGSNDPDREAYYLDRQKPCASGDLASPHRGGNSCASPTFIQIARRYRCSQHNTVQQHLGCDGFSRRAPRQRLRPGGGPGPYGTTNTSPQQQLAPSALRAHERANLIAVRLTPEYRGRSVSLSIADKSFSYLHTWTELYQPQFIDRNAFPVSSEIAPTPAACHDTGLAALAQLAALRIGVHRAFVTIISRQTEYVLVESTRTMSLQSDFTTDEEDKSWLGTSCFARADGINDTALDGWRKARKYRDIPESSEHYYTEGTSPHWCIVNNAGLNPELCQRPFVARAKRMRFFFSVPLRDSDGTVIGSLSLIDDKPRYGVSAHEMLFCEDLSDTIVQHLFDAMVSAQRQRSERLIKALGTFNSGGRSLREWFIGQHSPGNHRGGRRKDVAQANTAENNSARFDHEFGVEGEDSSSSREGSLSRAGGLGSSASQIQPRHFSFTSEENNQAAYDRNSNRVSGVDFQSDPPQAPPRDGSRPPASETQNSAPQPKIRKESHKNAKDFDAAAQLKEAYSRASSLLREATGAFGVVFLDASAASAARPLNASSLQQTGTDRSNSPDNTTSDDSAVRTNSDTDSSGNGGKRPKLCKSLGRSIQFQPGNTGPGNTLPLQLNERDMAKMIKSYPSGKVFDFAVSGTPYSGSDESAGSSLEAKPKLPRADTKHNRHARLLRKVVGDARSIAFFPIFDATNNRYRSCLITWNVQPNRFFDTQEDMIYLSAFGHSLRAEFSRIETIASDVAKGIFISSISHELRLVPERNSRCGLD